MAELEDKDIGEKHGSDLQIRYRPIRIGLCIKEGDLEEFRNALWLTHTLCGGRFNPIIPLGDPRLTRQLIKKQTPQVLREESYA